MILMWITQGHTSYSTRATADFVGCISETTCKFETQERAIANPTSIRETHHPKMKMMLRRAFDEHHLAKRTAS